MYYDVTRRLELLRQVRETPEQLQRYFDHFKNQLFNINIEELGCSKNAWCS